MLDYVYIDLGNWRRSYGVGEEVNGAYREDNIEKC